VVAPHTQSRNGAAPARSGRATPRWDKPVSVKIEIVTRAFGNTQALRDVSLEI
jgi:hypothetical protein